MHTRVWLQKFLEFLVELPLLVELESLLHLGPVLLEDFVKSGSEPHLSLSSRLVVLSIAQFFQVSLPIGQAVFEYGLSLLVRRALALHAAHYLLLTL